MKQFAIGAFILVAMDLKYHIFAFRLLRKMNQVQTNVLKNLNFLKKGYSEIEPCELNVMKLLNQAKTSNNYSSSKL